MNVEEKPLITIPKSLVQALGIKTGDQYEFKIGKQGELILKKSS